MADKPIDITTGKKSGRGGKRSGAGRKGPTITDSRENRRIQIDLKVVEALCRVGATQEDLAAEFGCSLRSIKNYMKRNAKFREIVDNAKLRGKLSIRRKLWMRAMDGSDACLIFLNKNENGMSDRGYLEMAGKDGKPIEIADATVVRERLASRIAGLAARLRPSEDSEGSE